MGWTWFLIFALLGCQRASIDPFASTPKLKLVDSFRLPPKMVGVQYLGDHLILTSDLDAILKPDLPVSRAYIVDTQQKKIVKNLSLAPNPTFNKVIHENHRFATQLTYEMKVQVFDTKTLEQVATLDFQDPYASWGNLFLQDQQDVYIRTRGSLYKYNLTHLLNDPQPQSIWVFSDTGRALPDPIDSVAVDPTHVYVGAEDTEPGETSRKTAVYALDKTTGKILWKKNDIFLQTVRMDDRLGATVATDPSESGVYVAQDAANRLYRLNADTGAVEWGPVPFAPKGCTTVPNVPVDNVQVTSRTVVVTPRSDHCIMGMDKQTGARKWMFNSPLGATFISDPLMIGDVMYQVERRILALDTHTGKLIGISAESDEADGNDGILTYDSDSNLIWRATGTGVLRAYQPVQVPGAKQKD